MDCVGGASDADLNAAAHCITSNSGGTGVDLLNDPPSIAGPSRSYDTEFDAHYVAHDIGSILTNPFDVPDTHCAYSYPTHPPDTHPTNFEADARSDISTSIFGDNRQSETPLE